MRATRHEVRGREYALPGTLDELAGPESGVVELPLELYWGPGGSRFDLGDRTMRRVAYQAVLQEGTADDIRAYVNRGHLVRDWPELFLPVVLAKQWQARFPERRGNEAADW